MLVFLLCDALSRLFAGEKVSESTIVPFEGFEVDSEVSVDPINADDTQKISSSGTTRLDSTLPLSQSMKQILFPPTVTTIEDPV